MIGLYSIGMNNENTNAAKTTTISTRILALVASGMDVMDAMKEICGSEIVEKMIGDLYHQLRAKSN